MSFGRALTALCIAIGICAFAGHAGADVERLVIRPGPPLDPPSPFPGTLLRVFRHASKLSYGRTRADVTRWRTAEADVIITVRAGRDTLRFEVTKSGRRPAEEHTVTAPSPEELVPAVEQALAEKDGTPARTYHPPAIPAEALEAFEKAVSVDGDSPEELIERRSQLEIVVHKAPDWPLAHMDLGRVVAQQGDAAGSLAHLRRAHELDPDHPDIQAELARAYRRVGRPVEALSHYSRALRAAPHDPWIRNNHAVALLAAVLIDRAERQLRRAIELEPDYPDAHLNLGTVLLTKGRDEEAERHYERAIELAPEQAGPRIVYAQQLTSRGRLRQAVALLEEAVEADPEHPAARLEYALALARRKLFSQAIEQLHQVLERRPDDRKAIYNLGICYVHSGRPDEAIKLLEASIQEQPEAADLYYALGLAYEEKGDRTLARGALEMALEKEPEFARAQIALDRVKGDGPPAPDLAWPWGGWCRRVGGGSGSSSPASALPTAIVLIALLGPGLAARYLRRPSSDGRGPPANQQE